MNKRLTAIAAGILLAGTNLPAQDAHAGRDPLFRVISVAGSIQARRPTLEAFENAAAKMYPLGTTLRAAAGAEVILGYKNDFEFTLTGPGEVTVAAGGDDALLRLALTHGKLRASFVKSTRDGDVVIETPGLTCLPGPEAGMVIETVREKDGLVSSTLTFDRGTTRALGPQFNLPVLKVGGSLRVVSALDRSLTRVTGLLGEFPVQVDNNTDEPVEYNMKPNAAVKISRQASALSGGETVAVLIINDNGVGHASYSYNTRDKRFFTEGKLRAPVPETEPGEEGQQAVGDVPAHDNAPVEDVGGFLNNNDWFQ